MPKSFLITRDSPSNKKKLSEPTGLKRIPDDSTTKLNNQDHCSNGEQQEEHVYEVIKSDHDYLELLVKVNAEEDVDEEGPKATDESRMVPQADNEFSSLAQLAEISLVAEGKSKDDKLSEKIRLARQRSRFRGREPLDNSDLTSRNSIEDSTSKLSHRMMQLVLPDNASHIIICTNDNKMAAPTPNQAQNGQHFTTLVGNNNNTQRPSRNQSYNCGDCGKTYSTSSNLARHKQTHRSLQDKKAKKCPHCSKVYVSMPAFSMHLRTHNQQCKCEICGKSFSRPWLLQGHIRTHTGERPFSCHLCAKAFADKSNLRAHIQTHSNAKPFSCRKCGKTFALKSYLYKHEEAACNNSKKN